MLRATFVRRPGGRDRVYVERADGTTVSWAFPSYGEGLPHDLCHLIVEDELGLADGFWGLVDDGVDVGLVNNQATLVRGTHALAAADLSGLLRAEAAVAMLAGPHSMAASLQAEKRVLAAEVYSDPGAIERISARLAEMSQLWREADEASITVRFPGAG